MKLFSKKPAEAKSGASGAASTEPLSAERADEILREYSPEDNERQLTKWVARVVNVFSLFISLFLVYTAAFGQLPDRSIDVAVQLLGQSVYLHLLRLFRRKR